MQFHHTSGGIQIEYETEDSPDEIRMVAGIVDALIATLRLLKHIQLKAL